MSKKINSLKNITAYTVIACNYMYNHNMCLYKLNDFYLNKLLYYLNAIHLVEYHTPLFDMNGITEFQKWDSGVIIPKIYLKFFNNFFDINKNELDIFDDMGFDNGFDDDSSNKNISQYLHLNDETTNFIVHNLLILLQYSPVTLAKFSCKETQWQNTNRSNFKRLPLSADENPLLFLNANANYQDDKTVEYYSKPENQFWKSTPKTTDIVIHKLSSKLFNKSTKDIIKRVANGGVLITDYNHHPKVDFFTACDVNGNHKENYKMKFNPYQHLYVVTKQNFDWSDVHKWISSDPKQAILGCNVIKNSRLCSIHNNYIELPPNQITAIGDYNDNKNRQNDSKQNVIAMKWLPIYTQWCRELLAKDNWALINQLLNDAKRLRRLDNFSTKKVMFDIFKGGLNIPMSINTYLRPTLSSGMQKLQRMIGLKSVKKQMKIYVRSAKVAKRMQQLGQDSKMKSLDMIFMGSPGTGKTQVARLVGKILYENHIIPKDKFIECSAKDLIGEYQGQTAPKTANLVNKAIGGVLFIDEAYVLATDNNDNGTTYNQEAMTELIRQAENHRSNLVVILAGYTDKMKHLLNHSNEGLRSRFNHKILFPDYNNSEMFRIFKLHAKVINHCLINQNDCAYIDKHIPKFVAFAKKCKDNSNGRLMRNLLQAMIEARNYREGNQAQQMNLSQLNTITLSDIKLGFKNAYQQEKNNKSSNDSKIKQGTKDKENHKKKISHSKILNL